MPGPVPKRTDAKHGHRTQAELGRVTKAAGAAVVRIPAADKEWHPLARDWYRSLRQSGQAQFYEPSDWQQARILAHALSQHLTTGKPISAMALGQWLTGATELLTTEGARRRTQIELQRHGQADADQDATITALDAYREQLGG